MFAVICVWTLCFSCVSTYICCYLIWDYIFDIHHWCGWQTCISHNKILFNNHLCIAIQENCMIFYLFLLTNLIQHAICYHSPKWNWHEDLPRESEDLCCWCSLSHLNSNIHNFNWQFSLGLHWCFDIFINCQKIIVDNFWKMRS